MHDNISLKTKFKIVMKYKNDNIVLFTVLISMGLVEKGYIYQYKFS